MILNVGVEDPAVDPQAAVDTDFMKRFEKEENENNGAVLKRVVVEKTEGSSDCPGSNLSKGKSDLNNGSKTNFCKCKTNSIDDLHTNWFERRSDPNEGSDTNLSKEKPDSIHRLNLYLPDKKRDPSGIRRKTIYSGINSSRKRLICSSNPKSTLSTSGSSKIASPRNLEHLSGSSRYNISKTTSDECGRSSNNLLRKSLDPKLSKEDRIINKPFKFFAAKHVVLLETDAYEEKMWDHKTIFTHVIELEMLFDKKED
uniref:Uncharacterized protein n=1 Tax=Rhabditophanes sp. KR3021 TaxID=114890 RepID=A0AC35TJ36_9BILA